MAPALTKAYGLSGFFAGLGAYAASMRGMGDDTVTDEVTGFVYDTGNNIVAYSNPQDPITLLAGSTSTSVSAPGGGPSTSSTSMSSTTILMLAAAGIFGFALLMGRK
jgi:hypothetical protein